MPQHRGAGVALVVLALAAILSGCSSGAKSGRAVLTLYDAPDSSGATQQAADTCSGASGGRYTITYAKLPSSADSQRQQLVRRLAAHDHSIDILALDVTWEAEFAEAKWILPWTGARADAVRTDTLSGPLDTATWHDQLVAAPWTSNTQLLWYRDDLVPKPPQTWAEMIQMATDLAHQGKPHLIEEQGAQYEGLTVWFNSLVASAGGSILDPSGMKPTLGDPALAALRTMSDLAHSPAADPSLSNAQEDQGRLGMESGAAAFEINYPFVYPSMASNKPTLLPHFKWARIPSVVAGQPGKSTIGGLDLGISAFSRHPDLAFDAAACLRNRANQEILAVKGGLPPTLRTVYEQPSPEFTKKYPFAAEILAQLQDAAVRPKTPAYQNLSIVISHSLSPPSSIHPASALSGLKSQIADALQSRGLVP